MTLPASASSLPSVQAEDFEGPLDLLLDEVRRQNVAIEKISHGADRGPLSRVRADGR